MSGERSMRVALQLTAAEDGPAWAASARQAEADGFDVLSVPDHLGPQFAPLIALAAAAAATRSIGLGTFVLAVGLRNAGLLAKEVATLDVLSGGRIELGLGAGWSPAEFAALGVPFPGPGDRLARQADVGLSSAEGGAVEALVSSPFVLLGRPADMVEHLLRLRQELGVTYLTVSARHADALRPALDELGLAR